VILPVNGDGQRVWEFTLPVIVVTRLRLKDPALLDQFFTDAVAAIEQAQESEGNLGADALAGLTNPLAANQTRAFPPPVEAPPE
jgi:hypothetical protein